MLLLLASSGERGVERLVKHGMPGFDAMRSHTRASRSGASVRAGVEACPAIGTRRDVRSTCPFSDTPTIATGTFTPSGVSPATAPPSSSTMAGWIPWSRSHATASRAAGPLTSSAFEEKNHTSRGGW